MQLPSPGRRLFPVRAGMRQTLHDYGKMKIRHILIAAVSAMAMCGTAADSWAAPAGKHLIIYTQPDGSTFRGYLRGDEFCHVRTTASGQPIVKDAEGWWCYAGLAADGSFAATGGRVSETGASPASFTATGVTIFPKMSARRRIFDENVSRNPMMREFLSRNVAATKSAETTVTKHGIVILAQFSDVPFKYSKQNFVDMLTQEGYSHNGAVGSARDYFNAQFGGLVDFSFDVSEIVTLPKKREYYGGNDSDGDDKNAEQMIVDACRLAAESGTDFSKYDDDNDGYVDNVFVFFSGEDEAETENEDCIWSHAFYIESGADIHLKLNGKKIDRYACTAELTPEIVKYGGRYAMTGGFVLAGIGTFCHEYSHTFGLPDLYDTDYYRSGGQAEALWYSTGLMDGGNQNNMGNTPPYYNAIDRECLGLGKAVTLTEGTHTLHPIHKEGEFYRMVTDRADEYYLIECRDNNSLWDKHICGSGLLVYHIDKSKNSAGISENQGATLTAAQRWDYHNEVNCRPDRQCADLVEPDPSVVKSAYDKDGSFHPTESQIGSLFFPSGQRNSLDSSAGLKYWSGKTCPIALTGIVRNGDGSITFTVTNSTESADRDTPPRMNFDDADRNGDGSFKTGQTIPLALDNADGAISVKWFFNGEDIEDTDDFNARESGTLKAVLTYKDGTQVTVCKRIIIR